MMSQQSQEPGTTTIIVKLTKIELSYCRINETDPKRTGSRSRIAFLD